MKRTLITTALLLLGSCALADAGSINFPPVYSQGPKLELGPVTAGTDYLKETAHLAPQPVYNAMPIYNTWGGLRGYGPITPCFGSCVTNPYGGYTGMYLGHR